MKKEVFKRISEKLKTDKKTRAAVITSAVGAVLVLTAAVTIPVALHNRVKVEADAESAAITAEAAVTESASAAVTEPETEAVSEITTEPTTAETTAQAASNNAGKNTSVDTNKGGSANKNGSSDSSAKKPNSGSNGGQAQQKPPVAEQPKDDKYNWTQADVDAAVAEAKRYAKSKGYTVYEDSKITVKIDGNEYKTSWMNPIDTRLDSKTRVNSDLHYQIDQVNKNNGSLCFLHGDEGVGVNIFSINHGSYWEIYVVY